MIHILPRGVDTGITQSEVGNLIFSIILGQADDAVSIYEVDVAYWVILTFKKFCICKGEKLCLYELN